MGQTILIYTGSYHSDEDIKENIIKYWETPYQFQHRHRENKIKIPSLSENESDNGKLIREVAKTQP